MTLLLLLAIAVQDDAKALYERMAKALDDAKTLTLKTKGTMSSDPLKVDVEMSIRVKEGNRLAIETTMESGGKKQKTALVCDGKKAGAVAADGPKEAVDAQADLVARALTGLKALGATGMCFPGLQPAGERKNRHDLPDLAADLALKDFVTKGDAKVGEVEAKMISYAVSVKGGGTWNVTLWLDAKSGLPIKREIEGEWEKAKVRIVETCEVVVNPELGDEGFEVPKK